MRAEEDIVASSSVPRLSGGCLSSLMFGNETQFRTAEVDSEEAVQSDAEKTQGILVAKSARPYRGSSPLLRHRLRSPQIRYRRQSVNKIALRLCLNSKRLLRRKACPHSRSLRSTRKTIVTRPLHRQGFRLPRFRITGACSMPKLLGRQGPGQHHSQGLRRL